MRVLVIGATGFIGKHLVTRLVEDGHVVTVFTRDHYKAKKVFGNRVFVQQWKTDEYIVLQEYAHKVDVVVNLAGENLASGRWTSNQRRKILSSRVNIGKAISFALKKSLDKPNLLIQASAIGYYGFSEEEVFTEESSNGEGFIPMVTRQWEDSVRNVEEDNTRKIFIRTGLVLGKKGGMLPLMKIPFRFFLGGYPGSGKQWLSWIHVEDEIEAILHLMKDEKASGPYNLTAPNPVQMREFSKILGRVMNRPSLFKVPGSVLKTFLGDMANETILQGQKVIPEKLQDKGFAFKYPRLQQALEDLV